MATINKTIEIVDRVKPNPYDEEDKFRWLSEVDGMVSRLILGEEAPVVYEYPRDMDTELLVPFPFDGVYTHYMVAMIDYHNREYGHYNNSLSMFNAALEAYSKAYIRENRPPSAGRFTNF